MYPKSIQSLLLAKLAKTPKKMPGSRLLFCQWIPETSRNPENTVEKEGTVYPKLLETSNPFVKLDLVREFI